MQPQTRRAALALLGIVVAVMSTPSSAMAADIDLPGCHENTLQRNDDGSWHDPDSTNSGDPVDLPFEIDFFGQRRSSVYVNNNGNVTFDEPLSDYVPLPLTGTNRIIIAPFWADVDTRPAEAGSVSFGEVVFDGRPAFCVLWSNVGYYDRQTTPTNTFQLLLVRGAPGTGDFDIVFRYDRIDWELGSASDNVPARAGFSNGDSARSVELAGSAQAGAFLTGGARALSTHSVNSSTPGTYVFRVRGGTTGNDPRNVPAGFGTDSAWWTWPDGDDDGLPDNWETSGVWVAGTKVDLPALGANPRRKDAFVYADRVTGERWNEAIKDRVRSAFRAAPLGIEMHFIDSARVLARFEVPAVVDESDGFFAEITKRQFAATGLGGEPGSVPALAKYVCVCPDYHNSTSVLGWANGIKADHMILTVYEQKIFEALRAKTGFDLGAGTLASDIINAVTLMHELGHLYGLRHHGDAHVPNPDPAYKSIMSYAYSIFGIPEEDPAAAAIRTGTILPRTDYSRTASVAPPLNLDWRMGQAFGALSLIYGQDGERGSFYSNVEDFAAPSERVPAEATVDTILESPEARGTIALAAQQIQTAQLPAKLTSLRLSRTRMTGRRTIAASFVLSKRARVRLTIESRRAGRFGGGRCLPRSSRRAKGKPCTYNVRVVTQVVQGIPTTNRITIKRRFAGRTLPRGSMRVGVRLVKGGATLRRSFRVG
jgi:hypothetical protein